MQHKKIDKWVNFHKKINVVRNTKKMAMISTVLRLLMKIENNNWDRLRYNRGDIEHIGLDWWIQ